MNRETAELIVITGTSVGILAWMLAIRFFLKMKTLPQHILKESTVSETSTAEAVKVLVKYAGTQFRIKERSEDGITLQALNVDFIAKFESQYGGLRFHLDADLSKLSRMLNLVMGILVLLVEPLVILAVTFLLWFLVVPNENPNLRWQSIQVAQIVHVLWPPFLIYFISKNFRKRVETICENIQALVEVSEPEDS